MVNRPIRHRPGTAHPARDGLALALAAICALAIGLFMVARIFPMAALDGTLTLAFPVTGDQAQHITGQRYFLSDVWRWPLLVTRLIEPPTGVNISLTDSVPLVALLAKPFRPWEPVGFHLIFAWVALCYVLQPLAAVFALRSAGCRALLPTLAAAVIAACMPAFIYRFGHAGLCSHFLILLAIGVYFRLVSRSSIRWCAAATLLLVCSLFIHPYFVGIVGGILAAAPLTVLIRGEWRALARLVIGLGAGGAVLLVLMYVGGYLQAGGASGFGHYSLNLFAPLWPAGSSLLPGLPMLDATGGQSEGYSWLGLGLVGVSLLALTRVGRRDTLLALHDHAGLVLAALGAMLFAASNRIFLGHALIADLPLPPASLQQFRASGRFVWVDLYILLVAATALLARIRAGWMGVVLLALALLQYADTRALRGQVAAQLTVPQPWHADPAFYRPVLARHRLLSIWPTAACEPETGMNGSYSNLLLLASERAIPVNTIRVSRESGGRPCDPAAISARQLAPGELRVILPGTPTSIVSDLQDKCHVVPDGSTICSEDPALATLPPLPRAMFATGRPMSLGEPAGAAVQGLGWAPASPDGAWTVGGRATLVGWIDPVRGPLVLQMTAHGLAPGGKAQAVGVAVNGQPITTWQVTPGADAVYRATLPAGGMAGGRLVITLNIEKPVAPDEVEHNGDTRLLGFFLRSFTLQGE